MFAQVAAELGEMFFSPAGPCGVQRFEDGARLGELHAPVFHDFKAVAPGTGDFEPGTVQDRGSGRLGALGRVRNGLRADVPPGEIQLDPGAPGATAAGTLSWSPRRDRTRDGQQAPPDRGPT